MKENFNEIKTLIMKMDSRLSLIEVRGDSVEHLLTARIILKTINEEIDKIGKEEEDAV